MLQIADQDKRLTKKLEENDFLLFFKDPRRILFLVVLVIPVVTMAAYQYFIATDRYESTAGIIISEEKGSAPAFDFSLIGLSSTSGGKDSLVVKEFAESKDMLDYLDNLLGLRQHYSDADIDFYSRLDPSASFEDFHKYFLSYFTVEFDSESKILTFAVQAFDKNFAKLVLEKAIERSEKFVDALNDRITRARLRFFEEELLRSEQKLKKTKTTLIDFQNEHHIYSTETEQQAIFKTVAALQSALAKKEAGLKVNMTFMNKTSPQIVKQRTEIDALRQQIAAEKNRLTGGTQQSLNELDAIYREILLNMEFNTNTYKSTLAALENARTETVRQLKYLIIVSSASLADESGYPQRFYNVGSTIIVCLMLFGIGSIFLSIAREHR